MDLDALLITETWLTTCNVSDQKIVGEVHHAARGFLKCETHLRAFKVSVLKEHTDIVTSKISIISRDDDNLCVCVFRAVSYRKYKSIDKDAFLADLRLFSLALDPQDDMHHLVDLYNNTIRDLVDEQRDTVGIVSGSGS